MVLDFDRCYAAISSRDDRFDGDFVTAVTSTGIYCRPSCPAQTPKPQNVRFYARPAAARDAGFRACRRCDPDAVTYRRSAAVVAQQALTAIAAGMADAGITAVAQAAGVSTRHLRRSVAATVGSTPVAVARRRRADTALRLLQHSTMPITEVALSSGYKSIRQFNDEIRRVAGTTPTEVRRRPAPRSAVDGPLQLSLRATTPFAAEQLLGFLSERTLPAVESVAAGVWRRALRTTHGAAVVELSPGGDGVQAHLHLDDWRDLDEVVQRCRRILDLDTPVQSIAELLGADPLLRASLQKHPGLRIPGAADPFEHAVRAVLGQQVSVVRARTLASRLVEMRGAPLRRPALGCTHLFPDAAALAAEPLDLGLTRQRRRALTELIEAVAGGRLRFDGSMPRAEIEAALLSLHGIGPWTAAYIAMRGLHDPDAFPGDDLGVIIAMRRAGIEGRRAIRERAQRWSPWRAYAVMHLWRSLNEESGQ